MPFYLGDDLDTYARQYGVKVVVQKLTLHMDKTKKGEEAFERDQVRMDKWAEEYDIKILDDVRKIL